LKTIRLIVDDKNIEAHQGKTVLESCLDAAIYIPHLCHHPDLSPIGACRLCVVEIEGMEGLQPSCTTAATEGMVVRTKSLEVDRMRRLAMELILAGHPPDCNTCVKYLNCELQSIKQYLVDDQLRVRRRSKLFPVLSTNPLFLSDPNKCILCGRCVRACRELRGVGVLHYRKKDKETYIGTAGDIPLVESGCRFCGACVEVCPTGAIMDKKEFAKDKSRKASIVPCRFSCPAEIDVPRYIRFIREKKYADALAVVKEKVPFPRVLGYVCNHPCEEACRRGELNDAISIRGLKRHAAEHQEGKLRERSSTRKPPTGNKVAIVGSGPAGLTAAYYLAVQGHSVEVFESLALPGGMLRYGIPGYRLPRDVIDDEIQAIENLGVKIQTSTRVDSVDSLLTDGFNAVLVSIGAHLGVKLTIPGADGEDILVGTDFLRAASQGKKIDVGKRVLVLGGGNVAFDCARVALRLGADEVSMACLESKADMPAGRDEIDQGTEEGIIIYPSRTCTRILRDNGKIKGLEFLEVESFGFDEDNNLEVTTVVDSRHMLQSDTIIFAIGQRPDVPATLGLNTTSNGLVEFDPYTLVAGREEVFVAGDAATGTGSVIQAIASGRKAAVAIDRFLGGRGNIDEKLAPVAEPDKYLGPEQGFAAMARCKEKHVPPEQRIHSFCSVAEGMGDEAATNEAKRCLQCDLRLMIKPVKFWTSY